MDGTFVNSTRSIKFRSVVFANSFKDEEWANGWICAWSPANIISWTLKKNIAKNCHKGHFARLSCFVECGRFKLKYFEHFEIWNYSSIRPSDGFAFDLQLISLSSMIWKNSSKKWKTDRSVPDLQPKPLLWPLGKQCGRTATAEKVSHLGCLVK